MWFTSKVQLVNHLYTFLVAKDWEWTGNASRYLQVETYETCRLTKSNGRFMQLNAWEIQTGTWLSSRRFTKNLDCLKSSTEDSETIQQSRTSGRSSTAVEKVILKPDCIFCNKEGQKKIKEKDIWTTEATAVLECHGWKTVLETAEKKDEKFLRRIRGFDLPACETRFHSSCRRQCQKNPTQLNLSKHYL